MRHSVLGQPWSTSHFILRTASSVAVKFLTSKQSFGSGSGSILDPDLIGFVDPDSDPDPGGQN